jgi:hypothetical protein
MPIMKQNMHLLLETRKRAFSEDTIQIVRRRSPNIKDKIVRTNLFQKKKTIGCQKCRRCVTCKVMNTTETIRSQLGELKIRGTFNCQSEGVVYCMECNVCQKRYVGETTTTVNTRFRGHDSQIRHNRDAPVPQHFNKQDHRGRQKDYRITVLDKEWDKNKRLRLEETWMTILQTRSPEGINQKQ